jgi:N utilization substance protein A
LQGEKIDIILWSDDPVTFAVNSLAPAEVSKVVMDEENKRFEVLTPESQLSLAIGRRGQNVRLASMLIGWNVTVVSENEAMEKRNQEYHLRSKVFMDALDCDEMIAHLLVTEGFSEVEELANVSVEDLASVEGFDAAISEELIARARNYIEQREKDASDKVKQMKVDQKLVSLGVLTNDMIVRLANNNIMKLNDLADLCNDELIEILPELGENAANDIIMKAREHWFK